MPEENKLVYKDPATSKQYKVKYEGSKPPSEAQITASLFPNRGGVVAPTPRKKSTAERVLDTVKRTAGQVVSGLVGGGYRGAGDMPPLPRSPSPNVFLPVPRRRVEKAVPPPDALGLAIAPVAVPAMRALSAVSNAPRNFAQGAVAQGLARYDASQAGQIPSTSVLGNVRAMVKPIFADVPGNVRAGVRAVKRDNGDKVIGRAVPSLAPDTLAGGSYNLATSLASDPLTLLGAAAPELSAKAVAIANQTAKGRKVVAGIQAARGIAGIGKVPARAARVEGVVARAAASARANPAAPSLPRLPPVVKPVPRVPVSPADDLPAFSAATKMFEEAAPVVAKPPTMLQKAGKVALTGYDEANGLMRGLSYGGDMSAPLRQGLVLGVPRPRQAGAAFVAQVKAASSEKAFTEGLREIATRPNAKYYSRDGLYLPDEAMIASGQTLKREEAFLGSKLADKIPGVGSLVRASDRAMTGYLSHLRAGVYDSTATAWSKGGMTPESHPAEYKALADWINVASGRGDLGALEKAAPVLSRVMASPRLQASRLALLNPVTYAKMPRAARLLALRDLGATVGVNVSLLSLLRVYGEANPQSGVSVSANPTDTDFGGVRIGKTKIDMTGGLSPWAKMFAQAATGTKNGKPVSRLEVVGKRGEATLSPLPSLVLDALRGTTFDGKPFDPTDAAIQRFVPLVIQDLADAQKEHGNLMGGALASPAFLGASVSTYTSGKRAKPKAGSEEGTDKEQGRGLSKASKARLDATVKAVKERATSVPRLPRSPSSANGVPD